MKKLLNVLLDLVRAIFRAGSLIPAVNIAEGEHANGSLSYYQDSALTETHKLVKVGSDVNHTDICGAADIPLGVAQSEITAAEITDGLPVAVRVLGAAPGTQLMRAGAAIDPTTDAYVVATASGRVIALPTDAGTYYIVGRPLTTASAAGDLVEVAPCAPVQRVVSA